MNKKQISIMAGILYFLLSFSILNVSAEETKVELAPDHPSKYEVVTGDTLWGIAQRFLKDPWQWKNIWQNNQQIKNPDLIYPGDIIVLQMVDGQYVLTKAQKISSGKSGERPTVKLSPTTRIEDLDRSIPTIPLLAIDPFLSKNRILEPGEYHSAPYIIGTSNDHFAAYSGLNVYVKGLPEETNHEKYGVYTQGKVLKNPNNPNEALGLEVIYLGEGLIKHKGDPATILLTKSKGEILNGSRLLPLSDKEFNRNFLPKPAAKDSVGRIVTVLYDGLENGVKTIGLLDVVAISLGKRENVEIGDVYSIYSEGNVVKDPVVKNQMVKLPNEWTGTLMVFRVFEKASYALVMKTEGPIVIDSIIRSPLFDNESR